jgi:hypothetical protein
MPKFDSEPNQQPNPQHINDSTSFASIQII